MKKISSKTPESPRIAPSLGPAAQRSDHPTPDPIVGPPDPIADPALLGGSLPPPENRSEAGTVPGAFARGARVNPHPDRYAPEVQLGRGYVDRGGFGSFIVPAEAGRIPKLDLPGVALAARLEIDLAALAKDGPKGAPRFDLFVTSSKQLKWRPALEFLVETLAPHVPGFTADDVLAAIAAQGLDPDKPLRIEGDYVTLHTLKVDSGVAEQPVGVTEGATGAIQRSQLPEKGAASSQIQSELAQAEAGGRNALVISMENFFGLEALDVASMPRTWRNTHGVEPQQFVGAKGGNKAYLDAEGRVAVDRAAIFVDLVAGGRRQQSLAFSDGVAAPMAYLQASIEGGQAVTAGKYMSGDEAHEGLAPLGVSHDKWHGELIPGANRDQILADGIRNVVIDVR